MANTASQTLETAFKTMPEKPQAGATFDEMEHVVIQLLPIVGLGRTMMAAEWLEVAEER